MSTQAAFGFEQNDVMAPGKHVGSGKAGYTGTDHRNTLGCGGDCFKGHSRLQQDRRGVGALLFSLTLTQPDAKRIKEKSAFPGDPVAQRPRITIMFTGCESSENPDATVLAGGYDGGVRLVVRTGDVASPQGAEPDLQDWTDQLRRVRDLRDETAFAALFDHFAPRVKGFLLRAGASETVAEDCAQDVMATVWHKAHQFDPARASVATWIFTIARNRRIDTIRRARRPEPEDLGWGPEPEPDQADAMVLQQESARLVDALAQLPEKQRSLIERAYYGELSHSEIAAETGLPLGTIKSRIRLALERLRHAMS
jgi:RNA polymerase sigma-70 factor (ECF subfamily)